MCVSHVCTFRHACAHVYTSAYTCGLIVFMCALYTAYPCMVIHTRVYYYKMVAHADRWGCTNLTIWVQKSPNFVLLYHNLITIIFILTHQNLFTSAEFNGLSSAIYRNEMLHSVLKVLATKNITWCNFRSHGLFSQAQSQICICNSMISCSIWN